MPFVGAIYDGNTHKTTDILMTIDIYVKTIDKYDMNICRTMYEAIDVPYFGEVKVFPKSFFDHCKNDPIDPQNIPYKINNNIKTMDL